MGFFRWDQSTKSDRCLCDGVVNNLFKVAYWPAVGAHFEAGPTAPSLLCVGRTVRAHHSARSFAPIPEESSIQQTRPKAESYVVRVGECYGYAVGSIRLFLT